MALFGFGKKKEKPAPETPDTLFQKGMDAYNAKDYAKALPLIEQASNQGHVQAQFTCGAMYYSGAGTSVDYKKALYWYEKAIQQGHADAQFYAGMMYGQGKGVNVDTAKAVELLEKAAAQGHEKAKSMLAALKAQDTQTAPTSAPATTPVSAPASRPGDDLTPEERYTKGMELFKAGDYDGAFPLLKRACSLIGSRKDKYPDGQAAMGWMYENGKGTEAKDNTAYLHYKIAAKNGNRDGMAGVVRLTAKKDVPSVNECQKALDYIRQLETEEVKSLLSTVERKLAEAQKREELKRLDLTEENVQAIFNQCGKVNEDGSTTWDEEKLASNKTTILYLIGQLLIVHKGVAYNGVIEYRLDEDFFIRYDRQNWTDKMFVVINLLNMGGSCHFCSFSKKADRQYVDLVADKLKLTLSPKDPAFPAWWGTAEALALRAKIADESGKFAEAMTLLKKAAELGDVDAQYAVGKMYKDGKGMEPDYAQAIQWYQKAAEQGHKYAEDAIKSCRIFIDALHGDAAAQCICANELDCSNPQKALEFMRKSVEQGYAGAQYDLGLWYAFGRNITKDSKEALRLFQLAAKQGHEDATELLALMQKTWNRYVDLDAEMQRIMNQYDSLSHEERRIPTEFWMFLPLELQSKFSALLAERLRKRADSL